MGLAKRLALRAINKAFIQWECINDYYEPESKLIHFLPESTNTNETLDLPFYEKAKYLQGSYYTAPEAYTVPLKNVIYDTSSGSLKFTSTKVIRNSIPTRKDCYRFGIKETYFPQYKQLDPFEGVYSVLRSTNNSYYHTLIDNLPRLFLLKKDNRFSKIKLLCPGEPTKVESFYLEKILTDKIELFTIPSGFSYRINDFLFSSFLTRDFSGYLHKQYIQEFLDLFNPKRPRKKINRIFIARTKGKTMTRRCLLNENELYDCLNSYEFKKYSLEKLSIEEQIELFYDAEYIIGAHGAGLTNMLFSENANVIELFASNCVVPYYYYLAKSLGHTYNYCYGDGKHIHANFSINIDSIVRILESTGLKQRKGFL